MTTDHRQPLATSSRITGPCGDTVSIGLVFRDQHIGDVMVETDGCESTLRCAQAVARLARGKDVFEAMAISAAMVARETPSSSPHCALLATSALYRALGQALLESIGYTDQGF